MLEDHHVPDAQLVLLRDSLEDSTEGNKIEGCPRHAAWMLHGYVPTDTEDSRYGMHYGKPWPSFRMTISENSILPDNSKREIEYRLFEPDAEVET